MFRRYVFENQFIFQKYNSNIRIINNDMNRDIYVNLFVELIKQLDIFSNNILKKMKSRYEISKTNNYYFFTYFNHHIDKLKII
jgi:hypothetical protein